MKPKAAARVSYPVLACVYKGDPKRFVGKFKNPKDGKWIKIPGGPFSAAVDTRDKALVCAARWYEAEFIKREAPVRLVTWADACDAFIDEVSARLRGSDATKDEARMKATAVRSHELLSGRPVVQHDEPLLLRWLRWFAAEPISRPKRDRGPRDAYTVRNYVKIIREIYRFAHLHGATSASCPAPANGVEFNQELKALVSKKLKREFMLEPSSIAAVLGSDDVDEFRKVWLAVLAYTGLRPGEAHGLRVGDVRVQFRVRFLKIERQFKLPRKEVPAKLGKLKTKNSYRVMPIHRDLASRLDVWIGSGWHRLVGREPTPADFLLPNDEGLPFREDRADDFREVLTLVNVPTSYNGLDLTPYATRHTFSTLGKRVGIPEDDRDYFMGHRPKSTRAQNYDVSDLRYLYVQIRKLPTFTGAGLKEYQDRMNAIDDIDEDELAPPG